MILDKLISCTSLKYLSLYCNPNSIKRIRLGLEGARAINHLMARSTSLESLVLGHNDLGVFGSAAITEGLQTNRTLKEIDMSNCYVDFDGLKSLLMFNENLERLTLQENNIQDDSAMLFSEFLRKNEKIKHLDLSSNNLTKDFLFSFSESLKYAKNLKSLNLENNKIGSEGVMNLGSHLKHSSLDTVNIGFNMISKAGITGFLMLLLNSKVENLNISGNEFGLECLPNLEKWLYFKNSRDGPKTTSLGLADCGIDDIIALEVLRLLSRIKTVSRLDLSNNLITENYVSEIMYLLKENDTIKILYMKRNRILRLTEKKIMQIMKFKKKEKQRKEPLKYRLKVEQLTFEKMNVQNNNNAIRKHEMQIMKIKDQANTRLLDWDRFLENENLRRTTLKEKLVTENAMLEKKKEEMEIQEKKVADFQEQLRKNKENLELKLNEIKVNVKDIEQQEKMLDLQTGRLIRRKRKAFSREVQQDDAET